MSHFWRQNAIVSFEKKTELASIILIRPFLDFEKKDLRFISNYVFNFFVIDPSNVNTKFQRIKLRNIISEFKNNGLDKNKLFLTLKNLKRSNQALIFYIEQNKKQNSFLYKDNKEAV